MNSSRNDTKQLARVRDIFDEWAITGRADGMERGHSPAALRAFARLELAAGQRYLDIGCGNGYSVRWAARVAPSVDALGIDVSPQMITLARQLTDGLPNARFRRLHFPSPLLPRRSFHALFTMEVVYYLPSLTEAVREMHGLLMPGGRLACVLDYYGENKASHDWPEDLNVAMHLLSAAEWQHAFENAGFEAVRQERLRAPLEPGQETTWKHTEGSLLITGRRRPKN